MLEALPTLESAGQELFSSQLLPFRRTETDAERPEPMRVRRLRTPGHVIRANPFRRHRPRHVTRSLDSRFFRSDSDDTFLLKVNNEDSLCI